MVDTKTVPDTELNRQVAEFIREAQGWCTPAKAVALVDMVAAHRPQLAVEIGVFGMSSLGPIALAVKALCADGAIVYGIDPWDTGAALEAMAEQVSRDWWGQLDIEQIYQGCYTLIARYGLGSCCRLIRAKAEDAVTNFADGSIGLLHIDGNHSEALSYKDAVLYLPKVSPGGVIFFDDVYWTEGGVVTTRRALNHLLTACERVQSVGDCVILRKRDDC